MAKKKKTIRKKRVDLATARRMIANYMRSEGCGCCGNYEKHKEDKKRLGKLLEVPPYDDGSGYDFGQFEEK